MTQGLLLTISPFVAALLWIALRRGSAPLGVTITGALQLGVFVWFGLFGLMLVIYFRTH